MASDPNQGQPQNPYSGYGNPQNPYGQPPQNPYATPPGYQPGTGYGTGYTVPPSRPLPLGEAIQQLPQQYIKVLTKPSALTFAEEMGKAEWGIVWIQLLGLAIISEVLGLLSRLTNANLFNTTGTTGTVNPAFTQAIAAGTSFFSIIIVPIFFFIAVGVYYLLAKMFGGQGSFLQQGYTYLLFTVPINIIIAVIAVIPVIGFIGSLLGIYGIILNIFSIMAVHRLSGGKATAVVLLPLAILFLLACAFIIIIIIAAVGASQPH